MLFPVITVETVVLSSAKTKMPFSPHGEFAGPQSERLEPVGAGIVLLVILNLAVAVPVAALPFWPKTVMSVAFGTSRIVLLLIVTTPCVVCPCTTARTPLPIPEPESFTPCVPMMLPSIFPTKEWVAGPVSAPAAVKALIAWLLD